MRRVRKSKEEGVRAAVEDAARFERTSEKCNGRAGPVGSLPTWWNPCWPSSKCPDFVVNREHYFGTDAFKAETGLSEFIKIF